MLMLVVQPGAPIEGKLLADARIPGEITVALLVRGPRTQRIRGDTRFEAGDEVAVSLPDRMIPVARQLFGDVHE
jgi:Trk K+ transport system NAD-binding subunit